MEDNIKLWKNICRLNEFENLFQILTKRVTKQVLILQINRRAYRKVFVVMYIGPLFTDPNTK